jgi:hypothetical protein
VHLLTVVHCLRWQSGLSTPIHVTQAASAFGTAASTASPALSRRSSGSISSQASTVQARGHEIQLQVPRGCVAAAVTEPQSVANVPFPSPSHTPSPHIEEQYEVLRGRGSKPPVQSQTRSAHTKTARTRHQHSQSLRPWHVADELARLSAERKQIMYDSEGDDDALATRGPLQELPNDSAPSTYITYRGKSVRCAYSAGVKVC